MRVPIEHQMKYIENDDLQYGEDAVTSDITGDDVHSFVSSSLQMKTDHYTTLKLKSSTLSCDKLDRRDFNLSSIKEEQDVTSSVQTNFLFVTDSTAVSTLARLPIRVPIEHQLKYTEDDDLLYEEVNVPNDISKENVDQSTLVISKETTPGLNILRLENSIIFYERCDKKELNSLKKKIEPPRRVSKEEAELMSKLYYESEDDCSSQEDIINNSNYVEKLIDSSCSTIDPTFETSTFLPTTAFVHDDSASCFSNLNDGNFISVSNYSSINKSLIESFVDVSANYLLAHQDNETKTFQQQLCIEDAFISSPTIDSLFGKNTDLPKLRSSYGLFQQVDDPLITKDFMKSDLFDVCSLKEGSKVQPPHSLRSSHTLSTVDNNNLLKSETRQQRLPFNVSPPSSARYKDKENIEINAKAECKASDEHHSAKKENGLWIGKRYFTKHHVIGNGGFSVVYKASSDDIKDCAIKCISLDAGDDSTISNYMTEIYIMKQLKGEQGIIQLFDYFLDERESKLYLVMERGDTDLKSFYNSYLSLHPHKKESLIKFCWKGMLTSVQILHKNKIIHLDLKPANFILVNDQLKVIDFGISKRVNPDNTSVTCNDIAGTCNFMSPESLCNIDYNSTKVKIGVKSDVWSLGCILYYLVYGAPPFHKITNNLMKALAIMNGTYDIQYPENDLGSLLAPTIKKCLARESKLRPSIEDLLSDPFLHQ
ncbi:hypothetical protein HELRODRAFT_161257 [Helobdella robusta]|uniref:Protein kinase domain-containing protein n=1 Tax=Helobdella robusta TaxID=6412 RepID=T1ER96_HELRO|nr:hypothetical protein HELRODRAFT_161257 [Helobdella robusta]ESO02033.1 hypothetical protein HELRODRAFT_161257 [Helobdella robusta]